MDYYNIGFYNLKVAATDETTSVQRIRSGGVIAIANNLYKGAGTLTRSDPAVWRFAYDLETAAAVNIGTAVSGASYPVNLDNTYLAYWHGDTMDTEVKFDYFINATTCTLAANQESNEYWKLGTNTLDVGNYTLTCENLQFIDNVNCKLNIDAGKLVFTSTTGLGISYADNTFTCGPGATISGTSAATTFKSQNNWKVVGKCENLNVTNEELKVTGQVINCTGDIIQQHPSQDANLQLDYDTADDRDIQFGVPDLDKNTELVT